MRCMLIIWLVNNEMSGGPHTRKSVLGRKCSHPQTRWSQGECWQWKSRKHSCVWVPEVRLSWNSSHLNSCLLLIRVRDPTQSEKSLLALSAFSLSVVLVRRMLDICSVNNSHTNGRMWALTLHAMNDGWRVGQHMCRAYTASNVEAFGFCTFCLTRQLLTKLLHDLAECKSTIPETLTQNPSKGDSQVFRFTLCACTL